MLAIRKPVPEASWPRGSMPIRPRGVRAGGGARHSLARDRTDGSEAGRVPAHRSRRPCHARCRDARGGRLPGVFEFIPPRMPTAEVDLPFMRRVELVQQLAKTPQLYAAEPLAFYHRR